MYKERNGYVDDGREIAKGLRCWNCNSDRYYQTVSTEHCPSCGIHFDYWGEGGNPSYECALSAKHAEDKRREEERDRQESESWYTMGDYNED